MRIARYILPFFAAFAIVACSAATAEAPERVDRHLAPMLSFEHETAVGAVAVRTMNEAAFTAAWDAHVVAVLTAIDAELDAQYAAQAAAAVSRTRVGGQLPEARSPGGREVTSPSGGGCGRPGPTPAQNGSVIPSQRTQGESGFTLDAYNCSSTASGKYQFLDSTWAGYGGYARAMDAPEAVQDAKAQDVWAGGAGCSHWSACG